MAYLIGIDIGTSGTKTVLFDLAGRTIASATAEYPLYQPQQGWAEQDPEDWWRATCSSVRQTIARAGIAPGEIAGIGLSGQMHGLVMLDESGEVLRRSIIWCDQRTAKQCVEMTERVGAKRLVEITANPALTGFTASKILWVKDNEPEVYAKCKRILLPKDYIRYKLTGTFAAEVSDASGMQLLDIAKRQWSDEVCAALGIDRALLAPVHESVEITSHVSAEAAALTGLLQGTPVAGGAGDQAAGAVGTGIVREGVFSSTIGTSGVVFAHTDTPLYDPQGRIHTLCHAVPGAWHIMGVTQSAGLSLQWFRDQFCVGEKETAKQLGVDPYVLMDQEAQTVPPGANGILYLPYLMGERSPHLNPDARGVFFGLSAIHTRKDLLRAVMEGVAYSLRDCLEVICQTGVSADEIRAAGGGGRSVVWRQMQADMFGCPVCTVNSTEGGALGVALLAGVGVGIWKSVPEACDAVIRVKTTQPPDETAAEVYTKRYPTYQAIYRQVKNLY